MAPLELLGFLPRPPNGEGVAKLLNGELLAYASASSIAVVDVHCMTQATALVGGHGSAQVTALDWHPVGGPTEGKAPSPLLLASGDAEGRVVVWDVVSGAPIAALDDALYAGFGAAEGTRRSELSRAPIRGLAWATARSLLAVLVAPGALLLWDYRSGGVVWRRDLGPTDAFNSLQTDPCDRRRLVLSTAAGAFAALRLDSPSADKTRYQRFQAEIAAGTLRCALPGARDILFLILQREIIAFDLEYGQPAAAKSLPGGIPAFDAVLASFGHAATGRDPLEPGIDALYCSHVDGSVSVWQRREGSLQFSLEAHVPLAPAALGKAAGLQGGPTGSALTAIVAGPWPGSSVLGTAGAGAVAVLGYGEEEDDRAVEAIGALKQQRVGGAGPGRVRLLSPRASGASTAASAAAAAMDAAAGGPGTPRASVPPRPDAAAVIVLALGSDGDLWQWRFPLVVGTAAAKPPPPPPTTGGTADPLAPSLAAEARLLGVSHSLSDHVTALSAFPGVLALPGSGGAPGPAAAGVCVAGTAAGSLELVVAQRGRLKPLHLAVSTSLAVHPAAVAGLRWLGPTPRVASFSCQRTQSGNGDWNNTLFVTDFRSGGSCLFRDGTADRGPLTGLRASPSGAYLLLVFKGMPSEVWATPDGAPPYRLRQIDLQFTSVEWILPAPGESNTSTGSSADTVSWRLPAAPAEDPARAAAARAEAAAEGGAAAPASPRAAPDALPQERLVFTLADGRVGVLSVQGRRIGDTKPRMPSWPQLASGEFRATCAASLGPLVFLGGADGVLVRWDTITGRTLAVDAGCGHIHGLVVAPAGDERELQQAESGEVTSPQRGPEEVARVAVLASTGAYAVLALDVTGQLRPTSATWAAGAAAAGRVLGIDWMPLPRPYGGASVLVVAMESGALAMVDVTGRRRAAVVAGAGAALAPAPRLSSPLLLPRYHRLLLRVLLQRGVPAGALRDAAAAAAGAAGAERLEGDLRARLPQACASALAAGLQSGEFFSPRSPGVTSPSSSGEVQASGSMAELLAQTRGAGGGGDGDSRHTSGSLHGAGIEEAAIRLGYRGGGGAGGAGGSGEVRQAVKNLGGAVKSIAKDVASAGKDHITKLKRSGGASGSGGGSGDYASQVAGLATPTGPNLPPLPPPSHLTVSAGGRRGSERLGPSAPAAAFLVAALAAAAEARSMDCPLTLAELEAYETALAAGGTARRMEVAAAVGGCPEEARFWRRLPATLRQLSQNAALTSTNSGSTAPEGSSLWTPAAELAAAAERSGWHSRIGRRVFESSEALQEKRVLEFLALGDLQAAVGFLLASPPARSARFYRDALCTLGMAFACGLQQNTADGAASGGLGGDAAARTLFVQAAKIVSANAAGVGDTLLGVPLMCATGEFDDAVGILQDAGLWGAAAAMAAGSLAAPARAAPLERWASHVADAEGRLWEAAGLLVGAGLLPDAADLLMGSGLPDAAAALVAAAKEVAAEVGGGMEVAGDGAGSGAAAVDAETAQAAQAAFESHVMHVLKNL